MNSKLIDRLKKHCEWWKSQGTPEDNGYPYHKHFPDCDICQAIAELERLESQKRNLLNFRYCALQNLEKARKEIEQLKTENAAMLEAFNELPAPGEFL